MPTGLRRYWSVKLKLRHAIFRYWTASCVEVEVLLGFNVVRYTLE
jgi:hypothetical protein